MRRLIISCIAVFLVCTWPPTRAVATGVPVVDVAAIAQLIQQVKQTLEMIDQLNTLTSYAELDHINLAGRKFRQFLGEYTAQFDSIMNEIRGYQNMFDQIGRLDEVYFPYHDDWETQDRDDPLRRGLKKQILWTRIQLKHAAKVGARIRETLPISQDQIATLLDDTSQAPGLMLSVKIGNQLTGMVGQGLQNLNIQMNEYIEAYSAKNLEENHLRGMQMNRMQDVMRDFAKERNAPPAPLNPVGAYK